MISHLSIATLPFSLPFFLISLPIRCFSGWNVCFACHQTASRHRRRRRRRRCRRHCDLSRPLSISLAPSFAAVAAALTLCASGKTRVAQLLLQQQQQQPVCPLPYTAHNSAKCARTVVQLYTRQQQQSSSLQSPAFQLGPATVKPLQLTTATVFHKN